MQRYVNYSEDCITEIRGTPVNKQCLVKIRSLTISHILLNYKCYNENIRLHSLKMPTKPHCGNKRLARKAT